MVEMWQKSGQQQQLLQLLQPPQPAADAVDDAAAVEVLNAGLVEPAVVAAGDDCVAGGAVGGCVLREELLGL